MWMHNGHIAEFHKIKRKLQSLLSEELFLFVQGNTDSEWAFALFLSQLGAEKSGPETLRQAMLSTLRVLNELLEEAGVQEVSLLNFAVTDSESVVCTRYATDLNSDGASLFLSSGTRFQMYAPGHYRMVQANRRQDMVVVASEPLTFEHTDWLRIPPNHLLLLTPTLNVLMYPIMDKFYNKDRV